MRELPRGTVTFLFTDIEGSTQLLHELGAEGYAAALAEHRQALRRVFGAHGGVEVDTQGDAFFVAFQRAGDAVACAAEAQAALGESPVRVRMGIHTGEPLVSEEGYVGVDVHRAARIAAVGHGGQVLLSQTTRDLAGEAEVRDLGEHRLKDLTAPVRLYQVGFGDFPPLATLDASELPVAASPLIGRESEVAELVGLVQGGDRLVTITGPGGVGKTRVGLQAAAELMGSFRDGVFWVPLAAVTAPELVQPALAVSLETRDDLAAHLHRREVLLVLDSAEHLTAAAPELGRLLAAAPEVRLLVTSRSPLHLSGEREYPLEPLPASDAAVLFAERARATGRDVRVDDTVAALCERLDNLPLALELAAARTRLLDPAALLSRLERRLPLLTGGPRDVPERQRTLRAAIEWSYDLLDADAQAVLCRLGMFAGAFSVEAAEQIGGAQLDDLSALVDASLLKSLPRGGLLMLDTIREYALERLEPSELADLEQRHAAYYARVADCRWPELIRGDDPEWQESVGVERANFHAALQWSLEHGEGESALAILSGIWPAENDLRLLREWLDAALSLPSDPVTLRRAFALGALGDTAAFGGDLDAAQAAREEALALCRTLDEPHWVAANLSGLADILVERGDLSTARRLAEESVAIRRERLDSFALGRGLASVASVALAEGDLERARALAEEAAVWLRENLPGGQHLPQVLCLLAEILRRLGEHGPAVALLVEALRLAAPFREALAITDALDGLAALRAELGVPEDASRLAGAAQRAREELGYVRVHPDRPIPDQIEPAWSEGLSMTIEQAVEYALRDVD